jgi:hypothetical protein
MTIHITSGYSTWIRQPLREKSGEVNFGAWWELEGARWRVSWIEATGELYAAEVGVTDRFVVLGRFENKKDINQKMQHWFEGGNLDALIQRLKSAR